MAGWMAVMVDKRVGGTFDIWVIGLRDRRTEKKSKAEQTFGRADEIINEQVDE
jgi:hypothetical protein